MTSKIFSKFSNFFKKGMVYGVIFSLSFPHFAWATEAIIELDFQDSQKSQQLHVIPRLSNIGDVSHVELDTKKQQVIVHRINQYNKNQHGNEYSEEDQQGGELSSISPVTTPIIIQKWDVANLPWELEPEKLTLFILNHIAWLTPLGEDGYKLEFRGGLLGGGQGQSTGGSVGNKHESSQQNNGYIPTVTVTKFTVDCQGRSDWPSGTFGDKFCLATSFVRTTAAVLEQAILASLS